MECPVCEHQNPEGSRYCNQCAARLSPEAQEGGRYQATVLFSDLSGYTAMAERVDPEEVERIMSRIKVEAEKIVDYHGGIVNQFVGDEVVALFGIPTAHEDDPVRAVRAALAIHTYVREMSGEVEEKVGTRLRMHSGITTGEVVTNLNDRRDGRYGLTGDAVNLGARLEDCAESDQIFVSPRTNRLIAAFINTEPLRALLIDGKSLPVAPHRVLGEINDPTQVDADWRANLKPFEGRENEMVTLNACLEKALRGQGQLVTLSGQAGMGKSRLLYEFRKFHEQKSITFLRGRCISYGKDTPYLPFIEALRIGLGLREIDNQEAALEIALNSLKAIDSALEQYFPFYLHLLSIQDDAYRLPENLRGEEFRKSLEKALAALLTVSVRHQPMVLILEDWQCSDEGSDAIVKNLIGLIPQYPIMVVISYRPEFEPHWGYLSHHTHLSLQPLIFEITGKIIQTIIEAEDIPRGLSEIIHQRTEGNPLFIEELCRDLMEKNFITINDGRVALSRSLEFLEIPDSVKAVILARVDRLEENTKEVLRVASVIGEQFTGEVLDRICVDRTDIPRALEKLKYLDVIRQIKAFPEVLYQFNHTITQSVVYGRILIHRRKEFHGLIGNAIEELYSDRHDEHYEVLAHHYRHSAITDKALHYLERSGDKAANYFTLTEARNHYWIAIELLTSLDQNSEFQLRRVDLTLKLAAVCFFSPSNKLIAALEASIEISMNLQDESRLTKSTFWMGFMNYALGNYAIALEQFGSCMEMVEDGPNEDLKPLSINYLGRINFYLSEFSRSRKYLQEGIQLLEELGLVAETANSMGALVMVYGFTGEFGKCAPLYSKVLNIAKSLGNPALKSLGLACHGLTELLRGNWAKAEKYLADATQISSRIGSVVLEGLSLWGLGYAASMGGNPERGVAVMEDGIRKIENADSRFGLSACYGMMSEVYVEAGDWTTGLSIANKALEIVQTGGGKLGELSAYRTLAIVTALEDGKKAETIMNKGIRLAEEQGSLPNQAIGHFRYAKLLQEKGNLPLAKENLDRARKMFREMKMTWWLKQAKELRGFIPSK